MGLLRSGVRSGASAQEAACARGQEGGTGRDPVGKGGEAVKNCWMVEGGHLAKRSEEIVFRLNFCSCPSGARPA